MHGATVKILNKLFFANCAVCEVIWKNTVVLENLQLTI